MEFAVVNTLDFMDHKMYESDPDLMKALNKIGFKWVKGKEWYDKYNYNYYSKPEDNIAVIELKNIDQLEILAKSNKNKIYIDYEKHVILPTSWEVDD